MRDQEENVNNCFDKIYKKSVVEILDELEKEIEAVLENKI